MLGEFDGEALVRAAVHAGVKPLDHHPRRQRQVFQPRQGEGIEVPAASVEAVPPATDPVSFSLST